MNRAPAGARAPATRAVVDTAQATLGAIRLLAPVLGGPTRIDKRRSCRLVGRPPAAHNDYPETISRLAPEGRLIVFLVVDWRCGAALDDSGDHLEQRAGTIGRTLRAVTSGLAVVLRA